MRDTDPFVQILNLNCCSLCPSCTSAQKSKFGFHLCLYNGAKKLLGEMQIM